MISPTPLLPGHSFSAKARLTIATPGAPSTSVCSNARPRMMSTPIVSK
jgi:hypothetical protein